MRAFKVYSQQFSSMRNILVTATGCTVGLQNGSLSSNQNFVLFGWHLPIPHILAPDKHHYTLK
jgi:hypothetical protein